MPDVLFRLDAAAHLGMGHAYQSLALATALRERGLSSAFAVKEHDKEALEWLRSLDVEVHPLPIEADQAEQAHLLLPLIRSLGIRVVVIDHHDLDLSFTAPLRESGVATLTIDDEGQRAFDCDAVVNYNVYAHGLALDVPDGCITLIGPRYAILRDQFVPPPPAKTRGSRLLATMGGGFARGFVVKIFEALELLSPKQRGLLDPIIVFGPGYPEPSSVLARFAHLNVEAHIAPSNMRAIMERADFAVSGGGGTLYELARMGVPSIIIELDTNQERIAGAFHDLGLGRNLGRHEALAPADVASALRDWLSRPDELDAMAAKAATVVDGRGALRVAGVIKTLMEKNG